jgi:Mg-chelatase subunit ChlD
MRSVSAVLYVGALCAGLLGPAHGVSADPAATVAVRVLSPEHGATVRSRFDIVRLDGVAATAAGRSDFDIVVVLDISFSTASPSGIDVDGDGELGRPGRPPLVPGLTAEPNTDPGDSILEAEIMAARRLLDALDPSRVRVGLVTFSGVVDPSTYQMLAGSQSATVEQALTSDYEAVRRALEVVSLRGPSGGTDMQAGIKLALVELAGLEGSQSPAMEGRRRIMVMLTDGRASLPYGLAAEPDPEDEEAAIAAGELAADAGVRVYVFGLGPGANDYPRVVTTIAQRTGGQYVPVRRPGDVIWQMNGVSLAEIDQLDVQNMTLGEAVARQDIELLPDGTFRAFVPVRPGPNRIRVRARSTVGTQGSTELDLTYRPQELSDGELEEELGRLRDRTRDVMLDAERRRQEAARRSVDEARTVRIEASGDDAAPSGRTPREGDASGGEASPSPGEPATQAAPVQPTPSEKPAEAEPGSADRPSAERADGGATEQSSERGPQGLTP